MSGHPRPPLGTIFNKTAGLLSNMMQAGSVSDISETGTNMDKELSKSALKVQEALRNMGLECQVIEMPDSTRSAADAARAVECRVEQIVKSLIFKGKKSKKPVLVVASGSNRVDENKISALMSEPVKMAHADFVREKTGYAIGGVPPLGHLEKLETYIDEDLLRYDVVWAAAGTPRAVFKLTPDELRQMTNGRVVDLKK